MGSVTIELDERVAGQMHRLFNGGVPLGDPVDEPFDIEGTAVPVTASFGIVLSDGSETAEEVLAQADEAMGREKEKRPLR